MLLIIISQGDYFLRLFSKRKRDQGMLSLRKTQSCTQLPFMIPKGAALMAGAPLRSKLLEGSAPTEAFCASSI